jgi:hypothetical protein
VGDAGSEIEAKKEVKAKSRCDVVKIKQPLKKWDEPKIVQTIVNNTQVIARTKYEFQQLSMATKQPRHIPMS